MDSRDWVESLQSYHVEDWDYITELKKVVDGGMEGHGFIDAVSGIVNRGCHNPLCATGDVVGNWYPSINFCEQPDAICASEEHKELKWIAGMFYWVESLQSYLIEGWDYITELKKVVDGGMEGNGFIDAVSGIVNRGCHNPPCATGDVDGKYERSTNFFKVLAELPDAICASEEHKELKWIAGMFYRVESLQSYHVEGWDYITELKKVVDGGMEGHGFIDAVSGTVNRGCHNPPCATGDVDGKYERSTNFFKVLAEFQL
eukprot:CCRYP_011468-RA/>CCRYP_011468-RA protein AED:0.39 eAED:0.39 QI:0/0/0/1/0.33/0.25/4/0/258